MNKEFKYIVCTHCATYNHELYIKDALDGFTLQKTTFPVVYVIVDDASTDRTAEVIRQYLKDNFNQDRDDAYEVERDYGHLSYAQHSKNENCFFAVLYLKENHYCKKPTEPYMIEWTQNAKYHAICEGDDYWTDECKLQRQVDFLESHLECSALAENGIELNIETGIRRPFSEEPARFVTVEELVRKRRFPTASVLYRKDALDEKFNAIKNKFDTMIWCFLAIKGKFYYNGLVSSVYRRGSGVTITEDPFTFAGQCESLYLELQSVFPQQLSINEMQRIVIMAYIGAANRYLKRKRLSKGFFKSYKRAIMINPRLFFIQFMSQYTAIFRRTIARN